jgi:transglycosylase-like protein with SLT domain
MGSHSRPKGHARRNALLSAAAGGILLTTSPVGGVQLTGTASATDTVSAAAPAGLNHHFPGPGWDDDCWNDESDGDGSWGEYWGGDEGAWGDDCDHHPGPGRHRGAHSDERAHHHHHHHHHGKHRKPSHRREESGRAQEIARRMIGNQAQFSCFSHIIDHESRWNPRAHNPSGAYGLPQALPGRKMASAGRDWRTNPRTQIRWAIHYMDDRYGSPCRAWAHWRRHGNY